MSVLLNIHDVPALSARSFRQRRIRRLVLRLCTRWSIVIPAGTAVVSFGKFEIWMSRRYLPWKYRERDHRTGSASWMPVTSRPSSSRYKRTKAERNQRESALILNFTSITRVIVLQKKKFFLVERLIFLDSEMDVSCIVFARDWRKRRIFSRISRDFQDAINFRILGFREILAARSGLAIAPCRQIWFSRECI